MLKLRWVGFSKSNCDNSVNMVPLSCRLSNAQQIVKDIFEGVGHDA